MNLLASRQPHASCLPLPDSPSWDPWSAPLHAGVPAGGPVRDAERGPGPLCEPALCGFQTVPPPQGDSRTALTLHSSWSMSSWRRLIWSRHCISASELCPGGRARAPQAGGFSGWIEGEWRSKRWGPGGYRALPPRRRHTCVGGARRPGRRPTDTPQGPAPCPPAASGPARHLHFLFI